MPRDVDVRAVFQRRLRQAREARQLSQKSLGIEAGIDPFVASARINRYEQGVHEPDLATIQRLAKALQVPLAYLFALDEEQASVILAFDRLAPADRERLARDLAVPKT